MRKFFSAIAALAMFSTMSAASASVPDEEVSLGGIPYGASVDYVRGIYGAPSKVSTTSQHPFGGAGSTHIIMERAWMSFFAMQQWCTRTAKEITAGPHLRASRSA